MSKKRENMMAFIESKLEIRSVIQEKPYTAVDVVFDFGVDGYGAYITAKGFSKVKWPDEWDAEFGLELAKKKAVAKIYKEYMVITEGLKKIK